MVIEEGDYIYEVGYIVVMCVLKNRNCLDVIFCVNDIVVLGVIDVVKILGIFILNELLIVGFDDILMVFWFFYFLIIW